MINAAIITFTQTVSMTMPTWLTCSCEAWKVWGSWSKDLAHRPWSRSSDQCHTDRTMSDRKDGKNLSKCYKRIKLDLHT